MKKIARVVCCLMVAAPLLIQGNAWADSIDKVVGVSTAIASAKHLKAVAAEKKEQGQELTFLEKHPDLGGVVYGAAANQTSHEIRRK